MSNYPAGAEFDSSAPWNTPEPSDRLYEYYYKDVPEYYQHPEYSCVYGSDYNFKVIKVWNEHSITVDEYDDETVTEYMNRRRGKYEYIENVEFNNQLNKVLCKLED